MRARCAVGLLGIPQEEPTDVADVEGQRGSLGTSLEPLGAAHPPGAALAGASALTRGSLGVLVVLGAPARGAAPDVEQTRGHLPELELVTAAD